MDTLLCSYVIIVIVVYGIVILTLDFPRQGFSLRNEF
jgi:hypothetical protein